MKNKKRNNSGSTMVEVLVGFTLLSVLLASMNQIIKVSGNMLSNTHDMVVQQREFEYLRYKKDATYYEVKDLDISLKLDSSKTSGLNMAQDVTLSLDDYVIERISSKNIDFDDISEGEDTGLVFYRLRRK